jgi:hypothetical protein
MFILGSSSIRLLRHLSTCILGILFIGILNLAMSLLTVIALSSCAISDSLGPSLIRISPRLYLRKVWRRGGIGRLKFYLALNLIPRRLIFGALDVSYIKYSCKNLYLRETPLWISYRRYANLLVILHNKT